MQRCTLLSSAVQSSIFKKFKMKLLNILRHTTTTNAAIIIE